MDCTPNPPPTPLPHSYPKPITKYSKKSYWAKFVKTSAISAPACRESASKNKPTLQLAADSCLSSGCPNGIQTPNLRHQVPAADSLSCTKWVDGQAIKMTAYPGNLKKVLKAHRESLAPVKGVLIFPIPLPHNRSTGSFDLYRKASH